MTVPNALTVEGVREFVATAIAPRVEIYDRDGAMPQDILDACSEVGLWAPFLPAEYGGQDMDQATLGRVHHGIGYGCNSLRSILTAHVMVAESILRWGTASQREQWLAAIAGGMLTSFCLTGRESGSSADVSGTRAVRDGEDWIITGEKRWSTSGRCSELMLVFADTEIGMTAFLVPRSAPGVSSRPITDMLGARANLLGEVRFDQVRVGPEGVLGPPGMAAGVVMTGALALGRYSVAYGTLGLMDACRDACVAYTSQRTVSAGLLRDQPLVQKKITNMVVATRAGTALCAEVGRLRDAHDPDAVLAGWVAKYYCTTAATPIASDAVQLHGAVGATSAFPVARNYREVKVLEIIEGTTELQEITIARLAYRRNTR